jgi:excisionase family DNA binding protein
MAKRASSHSLAAAAPAPLAGEQLIGAEVVAVKLGVSRDRIWTMAKRDMIPFVRIGKRFIRFSPSQINSWIEKGGVAQEATRSKT